MTRCSLSTALFRRVLAQPPELVHRFACFFRFPLLLIRSAEQVVYTTVGILRRRFEDLHGLG